jgi:multidrug efflux pump subunit AcrB
MWIVKLALQRPYTFVVMAMLIVLLGVGAILHTPTDVFPEINIPVVSVIWFYNGLPAEEMEKRITIYSEYSTSATVNNIKHIESQTLNGVAVVKLYFQPNVKIEQAFAQVTAISQGILFRMPPGTKPPLIIQYNASSVPILQLSLSSKMLSEAEVYDWGIFKLRQQLAVIQGITIPAPYGGKVRQIQVDIDPERLHEKGLSPFDVANAVDAQSLMLPSGRARIGPTDYTVSINSSPKFVSEFDDIPIKYVDGSWVLMRDVAHVRDGFAVQQNVVRRDGTKGVLVTILKGQGASTLDIVNQVKALLPRIKASAPPGLDIELLFDQSLFVTAAVRGMLIESVIAACLTAALILLFLGSWRSTLIIAVSIPLSVLCSLAILSALGMTINVMTLGGLALAVGILVDDSTVEIENIHRNLAQGKGIEQAVLDGAHQIAVPAFVGTLAICVVFVSVIFLNGPARFLFVPLALAVVFAMLASYLLSRTLVPVMAKYLLAGEHERDQSADRYSVWSQSVGPFARVYYSFNDAFDWTRDRYLVALHWTLLHRRATLGAFGLLLASGAALVPWVGRDFFPSVDTGQFRLHVNATPGTRLEETERRFTEVEDEIRKVIPPTDLKLVLDNIGVPAEPFNLGFGEGATLGQSDGEILVSLNAHNHGPTADYQRELRLRLRQKFPDLEFYFQPADIVSQILNFGLAAPIDVRVQGFEPDKNLRLARELRDKIARLPGAEDVHIHQITAAPDLRISVDRVRAASLGLTEQDVANDVLVSLSGTTETAPNFWLDPVSGIPYLISIQTPPYRIDSLNAIRTTPMLASRCRHRNCLATSRPSSAATPCSPSHTPISSQLSTCMRARRIATWVV